jgi:hypothetical protein
MKTAGTRDSERRFAAKGDRQERSVTKTLGPEFVDDVIHSLVELDAEHLEALAAAAECFRKDAALQMTPAESKRMEVKMQLFSAVLIETRRNLRIFGAGTSQPDKYGYTPGRALWVD